MALLEHARSAAKRAFALGGLRVLRRHALQDAEELVVLKTSQLGIGTLIDVGANVGQYAEKVRSLGYAGDIVSFEPLTAAYAPLLAKASGDKRWCVMPRMALGERNETATIHVAHNLVSSSLLDVNEASVEAEPGSAFGAHETIDVRRLDHVASADWSRPFALKVDTQGFEMAVLRGAGDLLSAVALLQVEMSLAPIYAGGAGFHELYKFVTDAGFRCIDVVPGFLDLKRGELLQVDAVFVR